MKNICRALFALLSFSLSLRLLVSPSLFAFPDSERAALDLVSSQATSLVMDGDRFIFLSFGDDIFRIDTETFDLTEDQVPSLIDTSDETGGLDLTGDVAGLAIRGTQLFVSQNDGDLLTIDLNDITAQPDTTHLIDGTLGPLVADPEVGVDNDKLSILDKTNNAVIVYDISESTMTSVALTDGVDPVAPVSIVFVPFPTGASPESADKIYVTTNEGLTFVINEGGTATPITIDDMPKSFPSAAVSPDGNFLLVVNSTDNVVHVVDTESNLEVDADPIAPEPDDPISLPQNGSLEGIVVTDVTNPDDTYAFVTGSGGVSVINLNLGLLGSFEVTVIDFMDLGAGDSDDDPLPLDSGTTPGPIVASSAADGYVYTSNSNATISVLSDSPFVTISETSLGHGALTTGGSFEVTFQSDELGTYTVVVGGDSTGNGTEVASGTVGEVDTDIVTDSIAYDASLFPEGETRVFVFVTDDLGNIGRDATDITVDTAPGDLEIISTGFGDEKISVTFTRLTDSDIDHYNIYIDTDFLSVATKSEEEGTVDQPDSGDSITSKVVGLTNGVEYFVAVEAVDASGNIGMRVSTFADGTPASATPEKTVGLAAAVGEAGCALVPVPAAPIGAEVFVVLAVSLVLLCGGRLLIKAPLHLGAFSTAVFVCLLLLLSTRVVNAAEVTPQWWSLEFKGGIWLPTDGITKDFLGSCCDPTGNVEFGFLYKSKFGFEVGVGYVGADGRAIGVSAGQKSEDSFNLTLIPIQNSFAFRADFKEDQFLVPYAKAGLDYIFFRENTNGNVTTGVKMGLHAAGGLQILLDKIEDLSTSMESGLGVNDVYFTVEGRYAWVNNFGGSGIDLSSLMFQGGFLFEF